MDDYLFSQIISYEAGELTEHRTISLFQDLIDSGDVWRLQGHYGRVAKQLIEEGLCDMPVKEPESSEEMPF